MKALGKILTSDVNAQVRGVIVKIKVGRHSGIRWNVRKKVSMQNIHEVLPKIRRHKAQKSR
jgi:hypothetical protein